MVDTKPDKTTGTPHVVLLVDDQAMVAEAIRRMLEAEDDIEFHYCADPRQAIDMAISEEATVILQDLVMPDVDGMMLVRFFRANPETKDIPIIMLSSTEDPKVKSDAFANGANDYLVKLPDQVELIARIRAHSRSFKAHRELDAAYEALREVQQRLEEANNELEEANAKLEQSNEELKRQSSLDGLTGIANRRKFDRTLEQAWQRARRNGAELSLLMIDIDHFKLYNDTHGHQAGDDCLRTVAQTLSGVLYRPSDLIARYGGEEFAAILPETGAEGAYQVAERMLDAITRLGISHQASPVSDTVTLSIGIATARPAECGEPHDLLAAADQSLYRAKRAGRARIEITAGDCTRATAANDH
ncbi:MAG TPA: diguanylate cyclase [Thiotrichales bacterium]|nr:diguanylate cyclase [Thiotrichales bacterium]